MSQPLPRFSESSHDPCVYCGQGWPFNEPCEDSPDRLHWTPAMIRDHHQQTATAYRDCLSLAARELTTIADSINNLPARMQRKLWRLQRLDADMIRNEAGRCTDILTLCGR